MALRLLVGALLAALSIVALAWLVLQWGILPRLGDWRPELEQRASAALGLPVRIGAIEASGRGGWAQRVELREVRLLRADGGDALHLPRVSARLSPTSLLHWPPRFDRLEIDAPAFELRRDRQGRLSAAGIALHADGADDGRFADWLFSQPSLRVRGGALDWIDELRGAAPLRLGSLELAMSNGVRRHDFRLDASPPDDFGARFTLRGRFTQPLIARDGTVAAESEEDVGSAPLLRSPALVRPGDWRRWRGTLFAEAAQIDIERLRERLPLPAELLSGRGALRGWLEWRDGTLRGATVDLGLQEVGLQLAADAEPLALARLGGRAALVLDGERGELSLGQVFFDTADGLQWPAADLRLAWRHAGGTASLARLSAEPVAGGELQAQRLDLAALARLAERVPLAAPLRARLAEMAPQGLVRGLDLRWDGPASAPTHYRVRGQASGLAIAAAALPDEDSPPELQQALAAGHWLGRPGVAGADLGFDATERGGQAQLTMRDGAVELPGLFESPRVAIDRLSTQIAWTLAPGRTELQLRGLRLANADAEGEFELGWQRDEPAPGVAAAVADPGRIDLSGRLTRGQVAAVPRYLPLSMSAGLRHYLERALQGGRVEGATLNLRGPLKDFPFVGGRGGPKAEFRVNVKVEDARFAYLPGDPAWDGSQSDGRPWPAFDGVRGTVLFDRQSMELRNLQARLGSVGSGKLALSRIQGRIVDLGHDATLDIDGQIRGPLADMLAYVNATPVGGWLGGKLAPATATGDADLRLGLKIPLDAGERTRVRGQLQLAGNDLRLGPELPPLAGAQGRIDFSESSVTLSGTRGRALGGEFAVDGGRQPDGSHRFNVQGSASAEGLRRATELGALARLGGFLQGQAAYRGSLGFGASGLEWQLSSTLAGMGSELPAPLRKAAGDTLALRLQSAPQPDAAPGTTRELLRLDIGNPGQPGMVQALALRETGADGRPRLLRSAIGVGEAAPPPAPGGVAAINIAALSVDSWRRAIGTLSGADAGAAATHADWLPAAIALRTQELTVGGRRLTRLNASLTRNGSADAAQWRANLDAQELAGVVEWSERGAGALRARLSRLALPRSEVEAVSTLLERAPAQVPALDVVIDDFELRGKRLGRLEIEASNRAEAPGLPAEWQLSKLRLNTPDAALSASGRWAPAASAGAPRRTELDFRLDIADGGALLARLGQGQAMRGGKGHLEGQLGWLGSPLALDYASLSGRMNLALASGQFLQAEPGMARLLGVLSLQSLPRRLLLDFRDVFNEGFAFDAIGGDIAIERGIASTHNLRTRGVQALILTEGSADLERETQDLRVWVIPEINAGAVSLAYAAINPVVGLGAFVATWFLRDPLIAANTREFHVTGGWDAPQVERVERSSRPQPAALAAGQASAPQR